MIDRKSVPAHVCEPWQARNRAASSLNTLDLMENKLKLVYAKKQIWIVRYCMASRKEWHLPVQTGYGCCCSKIKLEISLKAAIWMHSTNLLSIPYHSSARPITDCLAASNGVCTKRNMARFELLLFENEVKNNSQTWPLIHLKSLATFYSKTLLLKWVMLVKE